MRQRVGILNAHSVGAPIMLHDIHDRVNGAALASHFHLALVERFLSRHFLLSEIVDGHYRFRCIVPEGVKDLGFVV